MNRDRHIGGGGGVFTWRRHEKYGRMARQNVLARLLALRDNSSRRRPAMLKPLSHLMLASGSGEMAPSNSATRAIEALTFSISRLHHQAR